MDVLFFHVYHSQRHELFPEDQGSPCNVTITNLRRVHIISYQIVLISRYGTRFIQHNTLGYAMCLYQILMCRWG